MTDPNLEEYLHPTYRVVSNVKSDGEERTCDNYHLFTAHWVRIGGEGVLPISFIEKCLGPNAFSRFPGDRDQISQDELIGAGVSCRLKGRQDLVAKILDQRRLGCWNTKDPGKFSWSSFLVRFMDLVPFLKACAGRKLWFWDQVFWCLWTIPSCFGKKEETSGRCLKLVQTEIMERYLLCRLTIRFWRLWMRRTYPGGEKELFSFYFGEDHPITRQSVRMF